MNSLPKPAFAVFQRDFLKQLLKFLIAFGLIGILVYKGQLDLTLLKNLMVPQYLLPLMILALVNLLILNYRWQILMKERQLPGSFKKTFPIYLIGLFFNYALPGAIGGDVIKAIYVAQDNPERRMDAIATVLVDRILGLYAMVLMTLAIVVWKFELMLSDPQLTGVAAMVFGLFAAMSLFLALALSRRLRMWVGFDRLLPKIPLGDKIMKAYLAIHAYRDHVSLLIKSISISLVAQAVTVAFMLVVGYAIGEGHVTWDTYFFAAPLGFIISAVPLAPAGIGVGQYAFRFLFELYSGQPTQVGQTAISAFQIALFVWSLLGAYFYLRRKRPVLSEVKDA